MTNNPLRDTPTFNNSTGRYSSGSSQTTTTFTFGNRKNTLQSEGLSVRDSAFIRNSYFTSQGQPLNNPVIVQKQYGVNRREMAIKREEEIGYAKNRPFSDIQQTQEQSYKINSYNKTKDYRLNVGNIQEEEMGKKKSCLCFRR